MDIFKKLNELSRKYGCSIDVHFVGDDGVSSRFYVMIDHSGVRKYFFFTIQKDMDLDTLVNELDERILRLKRR